MASSNIFDLSRLSLNQATLKHATLPEAVEVAAAAGYGSIGLWRDRVQECGADKAARIVRHAGLTVSSLCRGGFFTALDSERAAAALEDNRRAIDEAAVVGTSELIMVVGGLPANPAPGRPVSPNSGRAERDLQAARERVCERLAELVPYASEHGVRLVLEPMHPIFCADRGVISTLDQALDIAAPFAPESVGVVVDTYHVWWDPRLESSIARAGEEGRLASYQVCDWVLPLKEDTLNSRGYVGDGYIDFESVTRWIATAGYSGPVETEIFNTDIWDRPLAEVAEHVAADYVAHVLPHL
ncbi:sugar phosphate isomerase/epimerase family protein [Actinomyces sp. MRS3W]|uniref:sugar phosphate isomerase/epimerase family protein n=1 Tax=Actinomyces sp. MRS3W TaxID=2800796 RepID=UPI0028FD2ACB|nr:sugar phosphate isomerase/epimerase family protein [Actinomyces sp. MRS3W]MDU0348922.1 sugar phosphate isomerase/epimerase family protein [Actinomyces sp. MRS3W]